MQRQAHVGHGTHGCERGQPIVGTNGWGMTRG
jgi:hypothetical protein